MTTLRTWICRTAAARPAVPLALLTVATALIYASSLMTTISGCAHEYCLDTGEFQVALPLWGTVHYTGYPLYMLLGSPFVTLLRAFGAPPAMAASLYSLVWEVLAVLGLALLARFLTGDPWLAASVGLVFAVLEPIWVHGVIAEVYSLSMALTAAVLYLTFSLHRRWSDRRAWLLAFLAGAGVAHHRLMALLAIPVALSLLPRFLRIRQRGRWLAIATACFAAGFLPYLDIPTRVWLGSTWNYDRANTWQGFWRTFRGTEVLNLQRPTLTVPALRSAGGEILRLFIKTYTVPGALLLGAASLRALMTRRTQGPTLLILAVAAAYGLFTLFFHRAVLTQASLMGAMFALCVALALGLGSLPRPWRLTASVACLCWAAWLVTLNRPFVTSLTRCQDGVEYAATVERLEAPAGSIVVAPWGGSYFALAYAQRVEGRMREWEIVDHRADFGRLPDRARSRVYTHWSTLFVLSPQWWAERMGSPLRISSAGPGMVMLTARPLQKASGEGLPLGDGIVLERWEVRQLTSRELDVVLYWTATQPPSRSYSTFVHASDAETISRPEDVIAQSDCAAPVYGWYPTSHWVPGELVREDHLLHLPTDHVPKTIIAGMYWQDSDGRFHRIGEVSLQRPQD